MHFVDRRRVGHLLIVAGADLLVGDLGGDLGGDQLAMQRTLPQEFDLPLERRLLVDAGGYRLCGEQPDLDDRRHGGGAALLGRQARELLVEIAERELEVGLGDRLAIDRGKYGVGRGRRGRRGRWGRCILGTAGSRSQQDKGGDCQHADKLAAQQVRTHRRVSGGVGICIGIDRGNGRIRRRCGRRCNVDIGSAPSYLSFVFASRTDFWRL